MLDLIIKSNLRSYYDPIFNVRKVVNWKGAAGEGTWRLKWEEWVLGKDLYHPHTLPLNLLQAHTDLSF